jgi:hypothetical protein
MPDVHDVLNTPSTHVHDVLNTPRVHDVLTIDTYAVICASLKAATANPVRLVLILKQSR